MMGLVSLQAEEEFGALSFSLCLSAMVGHSEKVAVDKPERKLSSEPKQAALLVSALQPPDW